MSDPTMILGDDGKIHAGEVKFSGFIIDCNGVSRPYVQGVRQVRTTREAELLGADRMCPFCFGEVKGEDR